MRRTNWFDRKFSQIADNGLFPGILERLAGTPARLRALIADANPADGGAGWSARKELGHLTDLEPLWFVRVQELRDGRPELSATDLANRATHEADHDRWPLSTLVDRFEASRQKLVEALRDVTDADLERSAKHPRLGTPMRLIDHAYFIAEHDDHHIVRLRSLLKGEEL
jgi:uncharacterized damage-inducible protein DinB